jgi:hypothetical protein
MQPTTGGFPCDRACYRTLLHFVRTEFPELGPDLDSDGRTQGSPAIDRGEHAGTPISIAYDSIGEPRFQGSRTDLGAFEVE